MKLVFTLLCLFCLTITTDISAQSSKRVRKNTKRFITIRKPATDLDIFNHKMRQPLPITTAQGVLRFGKSFLGYAYPQPRFDMRTDTMQRIGNVPQLQPIEEEGLDVNLKKFDCVTFVENMVALTQTRRATVPTFDNFKRSLANIRYRNSVVDYAARLHYFSDWLFENEKRGLLRNITKDIGGQVFPKNVFYMSYKKDTLYGNMADSTTFVAVQAVEKEITRRQKFYIPKDKIADIEGKIRDGDIIAVTNRLEGMDIAHTGFAIRKNGRVYMIHASSQHHKVVITDVPLADYVRGNKAQTGIMVGRLK
jgi:hypothetical protein